MERTAKAADRDRGPLHEAVSRVLDGGKVEDRYVVARGRDLKALAAAFGDDDDVTVYIGSNGAISLQLSN